MHATLFGVIGYYTDEPDLLYELVMTDSEGRLPIVGHHRIFLSGIGRDEILQAIEEKKPIAGCFVPVSLEWTEKYQTTKEDV